MNMLRTAGLLGAAFMTMGSGGVAKNTSGQPATALEPEYVDESQAADAAATPVATTDGALIDLDGADASASASESADTAGPGMPQSATAMARKGKAFEIAFSNDYVQGNYFTGDGIFGYDQVSADLGIYFSDDRDIIGNVGVLTDDFPLVKQIEGLNLAVGARMYVALLSDPDDDVVGFAPGVQGRYGLPYDFGFPLAVAVSAYFAPDVLTLGDAEKVLDIDARVEAEFVPDIVGFVGFREFRFDLDEGSDEKAAEEFQVGARFLL